MPIDSILIGTCIIVGLIMFSGGILISGVKTELGDTYTYTSPRDAYDYGQKTIIRREQLLIFRKGIKYETPTCKN